MGGGPRDYTSRNPYLAALQRVFPSVVGAGVSPAQVGGRFPSSVPRAGGRGFHLTRFRYTAAMGSVADQLKREDLRRALAMSPDERVALAFRLGEEDLAIYRAATGMSRDEALRDLRDQRRFGRTPCTCMESPR